jgi:hypothetical protein
VPVAVQLPEMMQLCVFAVQLPVVRLAVYPPIPEDALQDALT